MDLNKLLKAQKIAVIGASEREGSFGGDTCRNIMDFSDPDKYFFVNPTRDQVFGKKCYPSISQLPQDFDLAVICTPQSTVLDILEEASLKGCGGALVYASGYSETGDEEGRKKEEELVATCRRLGIALVGPNCGGFINYIDDVYSFAFLAEKRDRRGRVGLISQSGQLALSLMDNPKGSFSYVISAGNSPVVEVVDYLEYLVDDEDTKVVALYLEGVTNAVTFERALRKAALKRKPLVILKTGRSSKGAAIAASHTGSLSGADKSFDAVFEKYGVIRVNDMEELLSTAHLFATLREIPSSARMAALSVSGGETIITADTASIKGLDFPDFAPETLDRLRGMLPGYATPNNPLDMTATLSYDSEKYAGALRAVMDDPSIDVVLLGYTLLLNVVDPCIYFMIEGIKLVVEEGYTKPIIMMPFIENTRDPESAKKLEALGVPILPPAVYAMEIMKKFTDFVNFEPEGNSLELALPSPGLKKGKKFLSEHASKKLFAEAGIPVPKEDIARSLEEAEEIAARIGYPLVMKIESEEIAHKSDVGGVKLNIKNAEEVQGAYQEILDNVNKNAPGAQYNGILMQEMLEVGREIIVGINNDPTFGPMILCGLGGVFVEIFKDVALYPAPLNRLEARRMVESLKGYPLLDGYRGSKKLDVEALVDLLVKMSNFAVAKKDQVLEADINPVFLYEEGKGLSIADGLVIFRE